MASSGRAQRGDRRRGAAVDGEPPARTMLRVEGIEAEARPLEFPCGPESISPEWAGTRGPVYLLDYHPAGQRGAMSYAAYQGDLDAFPPSDASGLLGIEELGLPRSPSRCRPLPEELAKDAIAHEQPGPGDKVRLMVDALHGVPAGDPRRIHRASPTPSIRAEPNRGRSDASGWNWSVPPW